MASTPDAADILSRLKFRVVQPVDIPRCHQLGTLSFTADQVSSTSELQLRQHHAAPFFRCVLLKRPKGGVKKEKHALSLLDDVNGGGGVGMPNGSDDACHHSVHGTSENELIGYICGTRCHEFAPDKLRSASDASSALSAPLSPGGRDQSPPSESFYPYSKKHEPHGPYLAIHSIVVQQEYRHLGVARAMLENYINAIEKLNGEVDEAGINRRRNKLKGAKTKIQKIILLTNSHLVDFFVSMGFRWKTTLSLGAVPLYELERDVRQSPDSSTSRALLKGPSSQPKMEPECYLVDSFANLRRWGSGNSAAIVLLQGPPSQLIADIVDDNGNGMWGTMKEQLNDIIMGANEDDEQEVANARADAWMHYVAKEFNQPATAFVWKLDDNEVHGTRDRCGSEGASTMQFDISEHSGGLEYDSVTDLQSNTSDNQRSGPCEIEYFTRFMSRGGIEVNMCAHATLAAASVLFRKDALAQNGSIDQQETVLKFHSRNGVELKARHAPPSPLDVEFFGSQIVTNTMSDNIRIEMDYPWRSVDSLSQKDQSSVIALLRRAFFGAWSVVPPEEEDNDNETDGLAFSLKVDDVLYMGLTEGGEDLLIELTVEAFDLLCSRSVDFGALKQTKLHTRGIIICCEIPDGESAGKTDQRRRSEGDSSVHPLDGLDFRSRYFEPKIGVNEDPVSGWPHCALGPYFGERRKKDRVFGLQESDRTGLVECVLKEDEKRVCIIGNTVITVKGRLQMQF
eukprot:CAMPEP_0113414796 /NCGR_PEP_ID=MMETSP0013_2-20120614/24216_1 /TAXON_ID=2843 ORGANISM="Skeletonema costatum, Strain 1716" /NCGR_SAMPLE_ID=MMETSP0013_2 /ASSEMBLY_ACC=CAM_ASM_000158 /LENGTH=737 /DNA_ID=CAMNT_0000301693 /DNA_START=345 /DNA_END=2558 /DNA_ORIENTATION=- /assembly_acc=CAM_ASM_000158